jgi:hypothetical protein
MSLPQPSALQHAIARLNAALGLLEATASRRLEAERSKSTLETELALMQDDRARLAVELDAALAHNARLNGAADDLARRIDDAIGSVRAVIDAQARAG